jgi:hypothetical protein
MVSCQVRDRNGYWKEEAAMGVASQGPVQSLEQFAEVVRQHQSGVCAAAMA